MVVGSCLRVGSRCLLALGGILWGLVKVSIDHTALEFVCCAPKSVIVKDDGVPPVHYASRSCSQKTITRQRKGMRRVALIYRKRKMADSSRRNMADEEKRNNFWNKNLMIERNIDKPFSS